MRFSPLKSTTVCVPAGTGVGWTRTLTSLPDAGAPSPSSTVTRTVRGARSGFVALLFAYCSARMRFCTRAGVALALRVTTRSLPLVPLPVVVPIGVPASLTVVPLTAIVPRLLTASTSCTGHGLATTASVTLPPLKSGESLSVTVAAVP